MEAAPNRLTQREAHGGPANEPETKHGFQSVRGERHAREQEKASNESPHHGHAGRIPQADVRKSAAETPRLQAEPKHEKRRWPPSSRPIEQDAQQCIEEGRQSKTRLAARPWDRPGIGRESDQEERRESTALQDKVHQSHGDQRQQPACSEEEKERAGQPPEGRLRFLKQLQATATDSWSEK